MSTINCLLSFTLVYSPLLSYSYCRFHYCNTIAILDGLILSVSLMLYNPSALPQSYHSLTLYYGPDFLLRKI